MRGELVSLSACSLFRRAVTQDWDLRARGLEGSSGLPDLAANPELPSNPRAQGSLLDWIR